MPRPLLVTDTITRPADTTTYAAGDVISEVTTNDHFEFNPAAVMAGGRPAYIDSAVVSLNANQTLKPDLELWLFDTDIAEVADNAAFAPTDSEILTLVGIIDLPAALWKVGLSGAGASGNIVQTVVGVGIPFESKTTAKLFGQLVVRNAYVPIASEAYQVRLGIVHEG